MRELHSFEDRALASRMLNVLNTSDLPAFLDEEDGKSVVWIRDDDHRAKAKEVLARFLADPNAPEFVEAEKKAAAATREAVVREKERQRRVIDLRDRWNGVWYKTNPATMVMFYICIVVAFATTDLERLSTWKLCNDKSSKLLPLLYIQEPAVTLISLASDLSFPARSICGEHSSQVRSGDLSLPFFCTSASCTFCSTCRCFATLRTPLSS